MKRKSKVLILLILMFPIFHTGKGENFLLVQSNTSNKTSFRIYNTLGDEKYNINYVSHQSILINSDSDFNNYSISGSGTELEPYTIESLNVTTNESSAISIANTTKFFTIRNCLLDAEISGIHLYNISYGTGLLENNNCSFNEAGIYCEQTNGITISDNTCSNNSLFGIYLLNCTNLTISNNYCGGNQESGILLELCLYSEIENNYTIDNGNKSYTAGIRALRTNDSLIMNNTCIDNYEIDILCDDIKNIIIKNNFVFNNIRKVGIMISKSSKVEIVNNTVTSSLASILIYQSTHLSIFENNLFITGLFISDDFPDFLLDYEVKNNTVNGYKLGFFLNAKRVKILEPVYGQIIIINGYKITIRNQLETSDFCGITLYSCNKVTISDLRLTPSERFNRYGIRILQCKNIEITNSIIRSWGIGIHFYESSKSIVKSCRVENNKALGILVDYSESIDIVNNTLKENRWRDMELDSSDYCEIEYNIFLSHGNIIGYPGLRLDYSNFNIIHHNAFIGNESDVEPQTLDLGGNNVWYDEKTSEGNYYSDWSGSGPYDIWSGSWDDVTDPYPLSDIPVYRDVNKSLYFTFLILIPLVAYTTSQFIIRRKRKT